MKFTASSHNIQNIPIYSCAGRHIWPHACSSSFLSYLFIDMDLGIQFLKDVGLIRSKETCNTCGRDMTWCADTKRNSFRWRCRRADVVSPNLSSTVHGFSILTSLYRKLCFSHTTSYAANLPDVSNKSIASVLIRSRTGASSAERPCSGTCRAALKTSAVLTRP